MRSITQSQFDNIIPRVEQLNLLLREGTVVDERYIYGKYEIQLFSLSNFYVEVWTNLVTQEFEKVVSLQSEDDWSGFLGSVKLSLLLD